MPRFTHTVSQLQNEHFIWINRNRQHPFQQQQKSSSCCSCCVGVITTALPVQTLIQIHLRASWNEDLVPATLTLFQRYPFPNRTYRKSLQYSRRRAEMQQNTPTVLIWTSADNFKHRLYRLNVRWHAHPRGNRSSFAWPEAQHIRLVDISFQNRNDGTYIVFCAGHLINTTQGLATFRQACAEITDCSRSWILSVC